MRKSVALITAILFGAIFVLAGTNSALAGGKSKPGELKSSVLLAYASTSGAGGNSGRIWEGTGKIPGIGKATVLVKASWNWSFYNGDHPSALVNNMPKDFYGCRTSKICATGVDLSLTADTTQGVVGASPLNDLYTNGKIRRGHVNGFSADATVTITAKNGDVVTAAILSGSVTEIQVPGTGGGGSINEWFIGFEITGGTGKFASATGTGFIHMVFDSGSAYTDLYDAGLGTQVYQSDPARFTRNDIFLVDFKKNGDNDGDSDSDSDSG